ncbi:hypothetical protein J6590_098807 [Homalodisca vitripennis]|nr:hypothetical protein J6590_098807 [Homalodisca vitripennis]
MTIATPFLLPISPPDHQILYPCPTSLLPLPFHFVSLIPIMFILLLFIISTTSSNLFLSVTTFIVPNLNLKQLPGRCRKFPSFPRLRLFEPLPVPHDEDEGLDLDQFCHLTGSVADRLKTRLEEDSQLTEDVKTKARNNLTIVMGDVQRAKEHLEKEKGKLVLAKRSWEKIRQARMHFTEELETLFPNVWLNDEKLNLPLDSLDPFIQNVLDNIVFLDKELSKLQIEWLAMLAAAISVSGRQIFLRFVLSGCMAALSAQGKVTFTNLPGPPTPNTTHPTHNQNTTLLVTPRSFGTGPSHMRCEYMQTFYVP